MRAQAAYAIGREFFSGIQFNAFDARAANCAVPLLDLWDKTRNSEKSGTRLEILEHEWYTAVGHPRFDVVCLRLLI